MCFSWYGKVQKLLRKMFNFRSEYVNRLQLHVCIGILINIPIKHIFENRIRERKIRG